MAKQTQHTHMQLLQQQWQWLKAALFYLRIMTGLALAFFLVQLVYPLPVAWLLLIEIMGLWLLLVFPKQWKIAEKDLAAYLNAHYPALEDSADLLLEPPVERTSLEAWQGQKIASIFQSLPIKHPFGKSIVRAVLALCTVLAAIILLGFIRVRQAGKLSEPQAIGATTVKMPGIQSMRITIIPPAYTGKPSISQTKLAIQAMEGSSIIWDLVIDTSAQIPAIRLNDSIPLVFTQVTQNKMHWQYKMPLKNNGLYQIKYGNSLSEHFPIELIPDLAPIIRIKEPAIYKTIDFGASLDIPLKASISDDYGIAAAKLMLTVASGGGEAVKFRDQEMELGPFSPMQLSKEISTQIHLQALKMQPGDELYYYIKAVDHHGQESRSDIQIINLPDTAELMNTDIVINSLNLKPEFFRSQRQIIIETEQLLRDKDKMPLDSFKEKSNALGIDQKLLRLRYGKFLGEESMGEVGAGQDDDHDHGTAVFGDASAIIDEFSHKHDNAEDASFFDPKTKQQLKAILNEMWQSELQLRTFFPKQALPFEYKALRLLKDLQQQSRAYVAKTSQKTTPIKLEKRLTADLSKIVPPLKMQKALPNAIDNMVLRQGMGVLTSLHTGLYQEAESMRLLQNVLNQLHQAAIEKPGTYLLAFEAMKRIIEQIQVSKTGSIYDSNLVISAMENLLRSSKRLPHQLPKKFDGGLSDKYFQQLNRSHVE